MVGNVIVECELFLSLIFEFLRPQKIMKFIHGDHFEYQQNIEKITCTSPYREECDSKIWIITDFKF